MKITLRAAMFHTAKPPCTARILNARISSPGDGEREEHDGNNFYKISSVNLHKQTNQIQTRASWFSSCPVALFHAKYYLTY